jgi:hypothetical protein
MMSNGVAIAHLPLPDPSATVPPSAPTAAPALTSDPPSEIAIGEAVASAACALSAAMIEFHESNGRVGSSTKEAGATRIAALVRLQMASFDEEGFKAAAHREGKVRLRKYLDAEPGFRRQRGANAGDATLTEIIDEVLVIVDRVVTLEKSAGQLAAGSSKIL